MKPVILLLLAASLFIAFSCGRRSGTEVKDILPQYEVTDKHDTINYVDLNGMRQGHWIIYEVGMSNVNVSVSLHADSANANNPMNWDNCSGRRKMEEGRYKNDQKTGYWKRFANNGSVKDSVNYN